MSNGMDNSLLDTYLYEENNLLDQLDELLVADEKNGDFSSDDVNEIFRIMHTIKGSSAMMEFNSISTIAHHIEDVFFYIREKGIESLDQEHKKELFNLMFRWSRAFPSLRISMHSQMRSMGSCKKSAPPLLMLLTRRKKQSMKLPLPANLCPVSLRMRKPGVFFISSLKKGSEWKTCGPT